MIFYGAFAFFVLILSALSGWGGAPWWLGLVFPSLIFGALSLHLNWRQRLAHCFVSAGGAWVLLCFVQDSLSGFLISKRIAGVFQLGWGISAYVLCFILAGGVAFLAAQAGSSLRARRQVQ